MDLNAFEIVKAAVEELNEDLKSELLQSPNPATPCSVAVVPSNSLRWSGSLLIWR